ncbi:MAG: hypothetical protein P8L64_01635 [Flavobacteriales bacterium]|nr:hypothetical protein [Flavobacteriales bacterium]
MVKVKIHVAVVAIGTHKHDSFVGHGIDELVAQGTSVRCSPLRQTPAVVDDQTFPVGYRNALHPIICI